MESSRRWRDGARALLALYLAALAFVAFWPTPLTDPVAGRLQAVLFALHHSGLPELINYSFVEFASNILLFAPIGILAALAFPAFHRGSDRAERVPGIVLHGTGAEAVPARPVSERHGHRGEYCRGDAGEFGFWARC
jgi:hypothetical protein